MRTQLQVLTDLGSSPLPDRAVLYDPVFDEYRLISTDLMPDRTTISHCPWCGDPLPSSRRNQWFVELRRLALSPDDPGLPTRFRTDAWWAEPEDDDQRGP
jgi:hypothetical protein